MLDIWTINIVAPTTGNDRYEKVALNEYPIICLGRINEVHKALREEMPKRLKTLIVNKDLWQDTYYYIRHINRPNGYWEDEKYEWKASEYTDLEFDEE